MDYNRDTPTSEVSRRFNRVSGGSYNTLSVQTFEDFMRINPRDDCAFSAEVSGCGVEEERSLLNDLLRSVDARRKSKVIKGLRDLKSSILSTSPQMLGGVSDIFKLPGSFNDLVNVIGDSNDLIEDNIGELFAKVDGLTDALRSATTVANQLEKDGLKHQFDLSGSLATLFSNPLVRCGVVALILEFFGQKKGLLVLLILGVYYYREDIMSFIKDVSFVVKQCFSPVRPQLFGNGVLETFRMVWEHCYPLLTGSYYADMVDKYVATLCGKMVPLPIMIFNFVKFLCGKLAKLSGFEEQWLLLFEPYPDTYRLVKRCDALKVAYEKSQGIYIPTEGEAVVRVSVHDVHTQAVSVHSDLMDDLRKNASKANYSGFKTIVQRCISDCESIKRACSAVGVGSTVSRVPPLAILLIGEPGIGKTVLMDYITTTGVVHKFREFGPEYVEQELARMATHVYSKPVGSKYWDGYNMQTILQCDEVGQTRDSAGSSSENNEYFEIINLVNDKTMSLNMAALEKKGNVRFNSDLIVGTTNVKYFKIESINCPEAYSRRWCTFEVILDPACGIKVDEKSCVRFDMDTAMAHYAKMGLSEDECRSRIATCAHLSFVKRTSVLYKNEEKPGVTEERLSSSEFIDFVISALEGRKAKSAEKIDTVNQQVNSLYSRFGLEKPKSEVKHAFGCVCALCGAAPISVLKTKLPGILESLSLPKFSYYDFTGVLDDIKPQMAEVDGITFSQLKPLIREYLAEKKVLCLKAFSTCRETLFAGFCERVVGFACDRLDKIFVYEGTKYLVQTMINSIPSTFDETRSIFDKLYSKKVALLAGAVGVASAIGYIVYSFYKKKERVVKPQGVHNHALEFSRSVLSRNVLNFMVERNGNFIHAGFGLGIRDRIVSIPRHYVYKWKETVEVNPNAVLRYHKLQSEDHLELRLKTLLDGFIYHPDEFSDVCFLSFPDNRMSVFKDVSATIGGQVTNFAGFPLVWDSLSSDDGELLARVPLSVKDKPIEYDACGNRMITKDCLVYNYRTVDGHCGLPVFSLNANGSTSILGIHIAGNSIVGFGVPLKKNLVRDVINVFRSKGLVLDAQISDRDHILFSKPTGAFASLVNADPSVAPGKKVYGYMAPSMVPSKTSIVKSPIQEKLDYPTSTRPAFLRVFTDRVTGEKIDPISMSTHKYGRGMKDFPLELMNDCVTEYSDAIINVPGLIEENTHRRILTYREAVEGIHGLLELGGIPRKTSAGYPYCKLTKPGFRGKQQFWGKDDEYEFGGEDDLFLQKRVEYIIQRAEVGERLDHVFFDFPKDERRPIEKALAGKTRKISACPVDLTICIRQYFGAFVVWYMRNRIHNGSAVGINMYSNEVDALVMHLTPVTRNDETVRVIAGDFGNYDGSLPAVLIKAFGKTVTAYYGDEGSRAERVRSVLLEDLANSRHILPDSGQVYEWDGSNASGNPLTTILNSWCNNVILRMALCKMHNVPSSQRYNFLKSNRQFLRICTYGDDNLIAVNSTVLPMVKQSTLTEHLATLGFEYTDEEKGTHVSDDRTIFDVSFLKRKFRRGCILEDREYVAPLAFATLTESIQWTKKGDMENFEANKLNISKMLLEASLHERPVFEEYRSKVMAAARECLDFVPFPNTYEECQKMCLGGVQLWC